MSIIRIEVRFDDGRERERNAATLSLATSWPAASSWKRT